MAARGAEGRSAICVGSLGEQLVSQRRPASGEGQWPVAGEAVGRRMMVGEGAAAGCMGSGPWACGRRWSRKRAC